MRVNHYYNFQNFQIIIITFIFIDYFSSSKQVYAIKVMKQQSKNWKE